MTLEQEIADIREHLASWWKFHRMSKAMRARISGLFGALLEAPVEQRKAFELARAKDDILKGMEISLAAEIDRGAALEQNIKHLSGLLSEKTEQCERLKRSSSPTESLMKIQAKLDATNELLEQERAALKKLQAGSKTLLQFIHRTHRLSVPFDEKSIRAQIQSTATR